MGGIWNVSPLLDFLATGTERDLTVDRVRWFRTRAALQRVREEVEILEEEFRRVVCSLTRTRDAWIATNNTTCRALDKAISQGYRCYAYRQAAVYGKLAERAQRAWDTAEGFANQGTVV